MAEEKILATLQEQLERVLLQAGAVAGQPEDHRGQLRDRRCVILLVCEMAHVSQHYHLCSDLLFDCAAISGTRAWS